MDASPLLLSCRAPKPRGSHIAVDVRARARLWFTDVHPLQVDGGVAEHRALLGLRGGARATSRQHLEVGLQRAAAAADVEPPPGVQVYGSTVAGGVGAARDERRRSASPTVVSSSASAPPPNAPTEIVHSRSRSTPACSKVRRVRPARARRPVVADALEDEGLARQREFAEKREVRELARFDARQRQQF